jgi:DNA helicase-2/ATP-dependent DNA helicase PcrA
LRFISELDPASVSRTSIPRAPAAAPRSGPGTPRSGLGTGLAAFAKRSLVETGLSVTALNHFLECPGKFLYLSILRLPQAPSAAAEKGTAMHEAISAAWRLDKKDGESIAAALAEGITEYLAQSLLAVAEKEAVRKELLEAAPAVAKALLPHFARQGTVSTERWAKTFFEGSFGGAKVEIPLHGKLDAILEQGDEALVYDYKTRQAMSANAIKGETKNSSGDYFRQLVFYKILLSDEPRFKLRKISPALVFVSPDEKGRCPTRTCKR